MYRRNTDWPDLACLLGIGTVTTSLAVLSYRKTS